MIGGSFTQFGVAPRGGIAKLDPDTGELDAGFDPGTGVNPGAAIGTVLPRGHRILIGGDFTEFDGQPCQRIGWLTPAGDLDPACGSLLSAGGAVAVLTARSNGETLVGGRFGDFQGTMRTALAKLPSDAPEFRLGPPEPFAAGGARLRVFGPAPAHYLVEASADLGSWLTVTNFTSVDEATTVVDGATNSPTTRFYRARRLP